MRIRFFRFPSALYFQMGMLLVAVIMVACTSSPAPPPGPTSTVPDPTPVQPSQTTTNPPATTIIWPFDQNQGKWAIVNAYRGDADHAIGGSPNNYAHLAMDFVVCFPAQIQPQGTCTFPAGWDTGKTDGQLVYAPVKGHVQWIDAGTVNPPPSPCRALAIELDDAPGYYIVLAHLAQLFHFGDPTKPLAVNDPVLQGEPIGKISSVSGAGCYGDAHHIHMALYYVCATCNADTGRQAVAFSGQWSISNCSYPDDMQTINEYKGTVVPCGGSITPHPSPTPPPHLSPTPTLTPVPTVTPTPVYGPPKLTVSPTNLYPGVCPAKGDAYFCTITITETADSHGSLRWQANADGYPFSPGSGTLSPGQSVRASLGFDCHSHAITITGPGNTVTGHWSCQRIQVSPNFLNTSSPNCTMVTGAYQCTVTLSESTDSPGNVSWIVQSSLNIQYSPASGTLSPGQSVQVTILFLPCQAGQITFEGQPASESIAGVSWSCP